MSSGCALAVVALFFLAIGPAIIMTLLGMDTDSSGAYVIGLLIEAAIVAVVIAVKKAGNTPSYTSNVEKRSSAPISGTTQSVTSEFKHHTVNRHKAIGDRFSQVIEEKKNIERKLEELEAEMSSLTNELQQLENYKGKPIFMSKEKFMAQNSERISEIKEKISTCNESKQSNLSAKQKLKVTINDNTFTSFEELRRDFEKWRTSKKITGSPDIGILYSVGSRKNEYEFISTKISPLSLNFGEYCFYLFPYVVLVFDCNGFFLNAYTPRCMSVTVTTQKAYETGNIPSDAKVLYQTWQHTRKDGGPDMRYSYNPRVYSVEYCKMEITIASKRLNYDVSNVQNCLDVEKALNKYTSVTQPQDRIKMLTDLVEICLK